ncbi:pemK-like family protein [Clostridium sporogenes]|uniref:PemK-like family protein n=1 Tax=Clostridium sporogenes TaxID=1509 RepID=A0A1L3NF15_CLOSG|nr:type II toxin-antitoxin system PemK/MazF family toxin [Clostridium sporogenes]APH14708.1 pemK-like family protein [Clostridium sporogenes]
MKYSDIKERHVYNVDFDPVKSCEFNGIHLAIVLKKNIDKKTIIVVPLTSKQNGEGVNKINIGKITTLPDNLKQDDSYAVYNQVRTVNSGRFLALKNDLGNRIDVNVNEELFDAVLTLCLDEVSIKLSNNGKIEYYTQKYISVIMDNVINTAYEIKRILKTNFIERDAKIKELQLTIVNLLNLNLDYKSYIKEVDRENGIVNIIEKCMDNSLKDSIEPEKVVASF